MPHRETLGDIESMALYVGQGVGLVNSIQTAGEIVHQLVAESLPLIKH